MHAYERKAKRRYRRRWAARRDEPPPARGAPGRCAPVARRAGPPGRALLARGGRAPRPARAGARRIRLSGDARPARARLLAHRADPHAARARPAPQCRGPRATDARDRRVRPRHRRGLLRDARPSARRGTPGGGHRPLRGARPDDHLDRPVLAGAGARPAAGRGAGAHARLTALQALLLSLGAAAALYAALLLALVLAGRRADAAALAGLIPHSVILLRRLLADPRVPRRRKAVVVALLGYLVFPLDLVPDFIPIAGALDDAIIAGLALRVVLRGAGPDLVREHWPGPPSTLALVMRLA